MKEFDWVEKLWIFMMFLCLAACVALLIYMAYIRVNGFPCPACGCKEWLQGDAHYYFIGGTTHKTYEHICENCGYIF